MRRIEGNISTENEGKHNLKDLRAYLLIQSSDAGGGDGHPVFFESSPYQMRCLVFESLKCPFYAASNRT